jgi:hypothetical protein
MSTPNILYSTGFLYKNYDKIRTKQGLSSQKNADVCKGFDFCSHQRKSETTNVKICKNINTCQCTINLERTQ